MVGDAEMAEDGALATVGRKLSEGAGMIESGRLWESLGDITGEIEF